MAKYYANTEIRYGKANDEGVQEELYVIPEGEEVTNLPKDVMKDLWDAGALRMEGGDAEDPRIEAARHASRTGEGVDNELTNPEKAEESSRSQPSKSTPAKVQTPRATGGQPS